MFSVEENEENGEQEADNEVDEEEEEGGEEEEEEEEGDGEYPCLSPILEVLFPGLWHRGRVGGSQSRGCGPPATGLVPVESGLCLFWAVVKCAPHSQSWTALSTHRCGPGLLVQMFGPGDPLPSKTSACMGIVGPL